MKKLIVIGIITTGVIISAFQMEVKQKEFKAIDETFKDHRNWKVIKTNTGTSPMIRNAHAQARRMLPIMFTLKHLMQKGIKMENFLLGLLL